MRDTIYSTPQEQVSGFVFDDKVANVFPDMIKRSVPGYGDIINMLPVLTRYYVKANTRLYDLGSSLGASTFAMQYGVDKPGCRIISVDNSLAMLEKSLELTQTGSATQLAEIDRICADIRDVKFSNASVVVMNFTLQFIDPENNNREKLIKTIFDGMISGGVLIISEKIHFPNSIEQENMTNLHLAFKRFQGYSELEIHQKRTSLENVLLTDSAEQHIERLKNTGFGYVQQWYQSLNFCSFMAVK